MEEDALNEPEITSSRDTLSGIEVVDVRGRRSQVDISKASSLDVKS